MYKREDVFNKTLEYFKGDGLATDVWISKYALKDSFDNIYEQSPDDMHRRLAKEIHRIELNYKNPMAEELLFDLFKDFRYIVPQGGPMSGIGNNNQTVCLSNCFVIGNGGDSYGGIMAVDEEQVQLMKRRGGVGHDLSHIRPKGTPVKNSALTSTGVVPFMKRYSNSTREVAQDGRRGALMLSISMKHPDAEAFIDAKMTEGKVTGANVSVKIDDEFMNAVINDKPYVQQYPIDSENPTFKKEVNAKAIWNKITHNAWKSAEPGILFWDTIAREAIPDCYSDLGFKTISTNPCGEIPLAPYDSCRLIALNLYSYVIDPFTSTSHFDYELFKQHVKYTQRIMDDIIDLELEKIDAIMLKIESDPEEEDIKRRELKLWGKIKDMAVRGRRTGIGATAEGDMIAALGYKYGTPEATKISEQIHKTLALTAYEGSVDLAEERGAFPIYDKKREMNNPMIDRIRENTPEVYERMKKYGRRNIALLTMAPTGTVSLMTQTTSGIEPVFAIYYKRRRKINTNDKNFKVNFTDEIGDQWEEYYVFHPKFLKWAKVNGYNTDEIKLYSEDQLKELIAKSPYSGATSADIDWMEKVNMQGAVQKWVDHSISVTINLPKEATEDLVRKLYEHAWKVGCKGATVYREGSRAGVLVTDTKKDKSKDKPINIQQAIAPERPKEVPCNIYHIQVVGVKWVVLVGILKGKPYEVFAFKPKMMQIPAKVKNGKLIRIKGGVYDLVTEDDYVFENIQESFEKDEQESITRLISLGLRHGIPVEKIYDQLSKSEGTIVSFNKSIARSIKKYINPDLMDKKCPVCGDPDGLVMKEGCMSCKSCAGSKCS